MKEEDRNEDEQHQDKPQEKVEGLKVKTNIKAGGGSPEPIVVTGGAHGETPIILTGG